MDDGRLILALAALAVLAALALLTWIAVRVEQGVRRPAAVRVRRRPPRPVAQPKRCQRLHVADLPVEWSRPASGRYRLPSPSEDDPPFPSR